MDVNEEVVKQWLHICKKQFTIENIRFKVYGSKGVSNYSDIDILSVDVDGNYYDYEIKWRSVYSIGATDKEELGSLIHKMLRTERIEEIKKIIGDKPYKKIFITTKQMFGKTVKKRNHFIREFKKKGIEIKFFEDIISELVGKIDLKGRYDSQITQTIRVMKYFKEYLK